MTVRIVTAEQAATRDGAAIAAGTPSIQLMRRAGDGAAYHILQRVASPHGLDALVFCGPGNNGGDGWIVAAALARAGMQVHVDAPIEPRSDDARRAREEALPLVSLGPLDRPPAVVVDALLGTGAAGALRGPIATGGAAIARARALGALIVSLDLPTGLDATTGEVAPGVVQADLTISFGTIKRGHLIARSACGELLVLDIGLGEAADLPDGAPRLVDDTWALDRIPRMVAEANKGTRRRLLIVGGDEGMAGAVALAARGALRAGIGMVKLCCHPASLAPLQTLVPEATAVAWPAQGPDEALVRWPHAVLLGPGLGSGARELVTRWLERWSGPVVLDADALNAFAKDESALGDLLDGRQAVVTPHPLEFARLIGVDLDTVLDERFEIGARLARALHAAVLLKGVPTIVTAPDGESVVSARGTPALAAAGSGDILGGIVATLLAQGSEPLVAAACAAWVHGRSAEIASTGRTIRGVTLDDVLRALGHAWARSASPAEGVLAWLPRIGDT